MIVQIDREAKGAYGAGNRNLFGSTIINEIYEAAVVPSRWCAVLDSLANIADAEGSLLFAVSPGEPRWLSSDKIRATIEAWIDSPFHQDNPRGRRLIPMKEPRFLTEFDAFSVEEIEQEPYYTNFLRPRGLGWCTGTSIRSPAGDLLVISIEKAHHKGPVPREVTAKLDLLRPHLARAAVLSARIGLERARATVEGLNLVGLPAAVLNYKGKVVVANQAFLNYAPEIRIAAGDRIEFSSPTAEAIFAMKSAEGRQALSSGASIPVSPSLTRSAFVAHIVPMGREGREIFSGAEFLMYITAVGHQAGPEPMILQALFDLSPAEARVAAMIAAGISVKTIAASLSVKPNTIRVHLKSIFSKTGTGRQAELASLLPRA